jgi:hypothetical protein
VTTQGPDGAGGPDGPEREPHLGIADPPQRVSGMRVPDGWILPGRPADLDAEAEDAWRQTGFADGRAWELLGRSLDVQARIAASGYTPRASNMTMAGLVGLWSRALQSSSDAAALTRRASYQSAVALVRQAIELIGAQAGLAGGELDEWKRWTHEAFGHHAETRATEIGVGHYFSGESIADDDHLRVIYRAASDFGRPNFGPTALFVANEATHDRYPLHFGDHAFHLGWTQLLLGWLLRASNSQLHLALHLREQFPADDDVRERAVEVVRSAEELLGDDQRCRLEEVEDAQARRRHLLIEFRRRDGDAPRRLLF